VSFTRYSPAVSAKYGAKPIGMVLVKESGLIMKLRGMMLESRPGDLHLMPCCIFLGPATFFAFYLTGAEVLCNHHRPPAG
jgi:hypothetical protein